VDQPPVSIPDGFEVVQRLGAGQTAVVWLAHAARGGHRVALKLPRPETGGDLVLRRMFENEVQITLKLDHPNVVRAYDGRPTGPGAFLALEYCGGGTLDQLLLERGRLPLDRALAMVRDVALGLEHAHEQRVLHRDVKPANVFLSEEGVAKLGDFGTGTFAAEDAQERVGTAFYMAPEIFGGAPSSMQSDIYSLGVLAYEVLAGVRPFLGESYDALMVAHMTALPRDLRQARPDLPPRVATVVSQAMSRDPTRRYQSVRAFLEAYRRASGEVVPDVAARKPEAASGPPTGRSGRSPTLTRVPPTPAGPRPDAPEPARERPTTSDSTSERQEGEPQRRPEDDERKRGRGLFGFFRRRGR
jgi:eukaryotic-like serine/threonine-protein kinase